MKYIPDIIPKESKVLPDYFKKKKDTQKTLISIKSILLWVIGILFIIFAFINITRLTLFFVIGFVLIPKGKSFVEKILHFKFTPKLLSFFVF